MRLLLAIACCATALASSGATTRQVELRRGDALMGRAVQRGSDVVVTVRDPRGNVVLEVDTPSGSSSYEPIAFVSSEAGTYTVELRPFDAQAGDAYALEIEPVRAASRRDRELASALRLYVDAFARRNEALRLLNQAQYPRSKPLYDQARRAALRSLNVRKRHLEADHVEIAAVYQLLGLIHDETGDYQSGVRDFELTLRSFEKHLGPDDPATITARSDLGHLVLAAGDAHRAVALFSAVLDAREKKFGPQHPTIANVLSALGDALRRTGELQRAEAAYRRAMTLRDQPHAPLLIQLGGVLVEQERVDEGAALCREGNALVAANANISRVHGAHASLCLAEAHLRQKDIAGARSEAENAVRIREAAYGPRSKPAAEAKKLLARVRATS